MDEQLYNPAEISTLNQLTPEEVKKLRGLLSSFNDFSNKQKDFNESHNHDKENSVQISFEDLIFGRIKTATFSQSIVDDGSIDLPASTSGIGFVTAQGEEAGLFTWTSAAVVTLISKTTNTVSTNTDVNLCIFDNGTNVRIRNRLGATKVIKYLIIY